MSNGVNGIKSEFTKKIWVDGSGKSLGPLPTQYPQSPATWLALCPDDLSDNFVKEFEKRKTLCGTFNIVTEDNYEISCEGFLKSDPTLYPGEKYLWDNRRTLSNVLVKVEDKPWPDKPAQIFVAYLPLETIEFSSAGGEMRGFSIEGVASEHIDESPAI